jgi:hypothetical protein
MLSNLLNMHMIFYHENAFTQGFARKLRGEKMAITPIDITAIITNYYRS